MNKFFHSLTSTLPFGRLRTSLGTSRGYRLSIGILFNFLPFIFLYANQGTNSGNIEKFSLDVGVTLSRFEQQVKTEIGGAKGETVVSESSFGIYSKFSYRFSQSFGLGLFSQLDIGTRENARFDRFDENNKAIVTSQVGGNYSEFWLGPLLSFQWRQFFLEVGHGSLVFRSDSGRSDLVNTNGSSDGLLTVNPAISWVIGIGGELPITKTVGIVFRIQYRVRYYNKRGGEPLQNSIVHGTQNLNPFLGVYYKFF